MQQKTLREKIEFTGIGVHNGQFARVTVWPADSNVGIVFKNARNKAQAITVGTVVPEAAMHATVLKGDGWMISTTEHLLAALWVHGVNNAVIEIEGFEVPILDGSALIFSEAIMRVGTRELGLPMQAISPREKIIINDEHGRSIVLLPSTSLTLEYVGDFNHPLVGAQHYACAVKPEHFTREIAPARTFGFLHQLPFLRKHKLAQGTSLGNTVVIGDELLNDMRLPDECIRHKVLDLLGDLSLLGKPLCAQVVAHKTGHSFNRLVIAHYLQNPDQWMLVD